MTLTKEMPRARGVTREQVWQAADALLIAGQRPTIERIRQHLGGGSPNTVSPHLDTWFEGLGARIKDPQAFTPAKTLPDPVHQTAQYLWEAALAQARAEAKQELADEAAKLREEWSKLGQAQEALMQERRVMEERLAAADRALTEIARSRDEALERATRADTQLMQANQDLLDAAETNRRLQESKDASEALFGKERSAWDEERRKLSDRYEANERRIALELDASRVNVKTLQSALEAERKGHLQKVQKFEEKQAQLRELLQAQNSDMSALRLQLQDRDLSIARLTTEAARKEPLPTRRHGRAKPLTLPIRSLRPNRRT